jgi:SWI/SNF-related matrix-associated actin-dependent regulator of chromatin subfamily A3
MLALILTTNNDVPPGFSNSTLVGKLLVAFAPFYMFISDYVVVPLSVLSNWEKQIRDHVKPGALSYCVYYGATRNMSATELKKHNIVITTYQTVTKEHESSEGSASVGNKKRKINDGALFDVEWKVGPMIYVWCDCTHDMPYVARRS